MSALASATQSASTVPGQLYDTQVGGIGNRCFISRVIFIPSHNLVIYPTGQTRHSNNGPTSTAAMAVLDVHENVNIPHNELMNKMADAERTTRITVQIPTEIVNKIIDLASGIYSLTDENSNENPTPAFIPYKISEVIAPFFV